MDPEKNPMRKIPEHLVKSTLGMLGKDEYEGVGNELTQFFKKPFEIISNAV